MCFCLLHVPIRWEVEQTAAAEQHHHQEVEGKGEGERYHYHLSEVSLVVSLYFSESDYEEGVSTSV